MLLFSSAYNEYTVISKEYTGPLYFNITGVDCMSILNRSCLYICMSLETEIRIIFMKIIY